MNKNVLKTAVMMGGLGGALVLIGSLVGGARGASIFLVISLAMIFGSYWFSDKLAIKSAGAREVSEVDAPRLYATVRDLTERANLPMPKVYISPNQQPNAFATGRNPYHAAVCVTQGLLEALPERELRGVLAHELGHVKHRDILIGSVAAAIATGITFLARMALYAQMFGGGRDSRDRGENPLVLLAMAIFAPIAAGLMQMALSRSREFEADRFGATVSGDPGALADALERIEGWAKRIPMDISPQQATAYIINPLTGRKVSFAGLFSTHPATAERVGRLRAMNAAPSLVS